MNLSTTIELYASEARSGGGGRKINLPRSAPVGPKFTKVVKEQKTPSPHVTLEKLPKMGHAPHKIHMRMPGSTLGKIPKVKFTGTSAGAKKGWEERLHKTVTQHIKSGEFDADSSAEELRGLLKNAHPDAPKAVVDKVVKAIRG